MDNFCRICIAILGILFCIFLVAFLAIDTVNDAKFDEIDTHLQALERYLQHVRAVNELQEEVNTKLPMALRWLELQERTKGE